MSKATFVKRLKGGYKYGRKQNDILVYTYRGYTYDIEDIPAYQREAWYFKNAHAWEQARIDAIISDKSNVSAESEPAEIGLDYFFTLCQ